MAFGRSKKQYEENGNLVTLITKSSGKKIKKTVSPDGKFKERQVISKYDDVNETGGDIKKTVTRTPGGVEKEIERGNKRIEVKKFKDEGVKSRKVINMKKNDKYKDDIIKAGIKGALAGSFKAGVAGLNTFQSDLKNSSFKGIPKPMYDNANSSKNTQIYGKISESKPLTTPYKYKKNGSIPSVQKNKSMYIDKLKGDISKEMLDYKRD